MSSMPAKGTFRIAYGFGSFEIEGHNVLERIIWELGTGMGDEFQMSVYSMNLEDL